jgi:hypothetical protein
MGTWRVIEIVGFHKGQALTMPWPSAYSSRAQALGAYLRAIEAKQLDPMRGFAAFVSPDRSHL